MARGYDGAFGRKINDALDLVAAVRRLLRRPRQLPAPALAAKPRPARASLVLARRWWFFNDGEIFTSRAARLSAARLPARAHGLDRLPRAGRGRRHMPLWPVWLLVAATVFLGRLPHRPEPRGVERDRRRLRGRHRRAADRERGSDARTATSRSEEAPSAASRRRTATSATASRRTGAARRPTSAATRTARSPTSPTSRATWRPAGAASGTSCPAAHFTSLAPRRARAGRPRARRLAVRRRRGSPRRCLRLGRLPLHAVRARARTRTTRILPAPCSSGASGCRPRRRPAACFVGLASWAKFAPFLLVPLWASLPGRARAAARSRPVRGRLRRSRRCSASGCSCSSRTRFMRPGSSGTGRSAGSSDAIHPSRSGAGASTRATPTWRCSSWPQGRRCSLGALALGVRSAAKDAAPARRAHRRRS